MLPLIAALSLLAHPATAQTGASLDNLRSAAATHAMAVARRQTAGTASTAADQAGTNQWKTLGTLQWVWIQDLSFSSGKIGYAAGGNGQIWKTTDGAETWVPVLNLGGPYYWYGVQALNANDVVISGFIDGTTAAQQKAVIRWSHDGGATWSPDLIVSDTYWANRVHFWDSSTGFVTSIQGNPNLEFRTASGGLQLTDWSSFTIDPNGSWFGAQFSALPNGHVRISGITYCESLDFAATWSCSPSIDPISDYATFFFNDKKGWVGGGGSIGVPTGSPPQFEGWVHRTTDGGATWSDRTLDGPWPIRAIIFVDDHNGWAVGGGGNFGGAYVSHDGGQTWTVELNSGLGLTACTTAENHVFCAGIDNNGMSHLYSRDFDHIRHDDFEDAPLP